MAIRVILAIILLFVVVAVSYIKNVRGSADSAELGQSRDEQLVQAAGEVTSPSDALTEYEDNVDSLHSLIGRLDHDYAESLTQRDLEYGRRVDSLFDVLDSVECELDSHYLVVAKIPAGEGDVVDVESGDEVATQKTRRDEVITFYQAQYNSLPSDLTTYERKVSLYEIRLETAKKFKLTLTELKQMRDEGGLNY